MACKCHYLRDEGWVYCKRLGFRLVEIHWVKLKLLRHPPRSHIQNYEEVFMGINTRDKLNRPHTKKEASLSVVPTRRSFIRQVASGLFAFWTSAVWLARPDTVAAWDPCSCKNCFVSANGAPWCSCGVKYQMYSGPCYDCRTATFCGYLNTLVAVGSC